LALALILEEIAAGEMAERVCQIDEGTSDVQKILIGRALA
jgi:hypothetical protein